MAKRKDRFGLDIPTPAGRASRRKKPKIKLNIPRGYEATQKPGVFKRIKGRKAKKKQRVKRVVVPSIYSKIYESHRQKLLGVITTFLTQELGAVVEWMKDMTNVKRKVKKTLNYHAFLTAGIVVLLFGIAKYLECFCTTLFCGLGFIIVGLAAIIIAIIYNRYS